MEHKDLGGQPVLASVSSITARYGSKPRRKRHDWRRTERAHDTAAHYKDALVAVNAKAFIARVAVKVEYRSRFHTRDNYITVSLECSRSSPMSSVALGTRNSYSGVPGSIPCYLETCRCFLSPFGKRLVR